VNHPNVGPEGTDLRRQNLPAGPVLLVVSTVRTRWAATVAAALLREQGASQVLVHNVGPKGADLRRAAGVGFAFAALMGIL
jgi:hypothetical protein